MIKQISTWMKSACKQQLSNGAWQAWTSCNKLIIYKFKLIFSWHKNAKIIPMIEPRHKSLGYGASVWSLTESEANRIELKPKNANRVTISQHVQTEANSLIKSAAKLAFHWYLPYKCFSLMGIEWRTTRSMAPTRPIQATTLAINKFIIPKRLRQYDS